MPGISSSHRTTTSIQPNPTQQPNIAQTNAISELLILSLLVAIICSIVGYQKYRTAVVRRQIKLLNRLWQLDSSKKLS